MNRTHRDDLYKEKERLKRAYRGKKINRKESRERERSIRFRSKKCMHKKEREKERQREKSKMIRLMNRERGRERKNQTLRMKEKQTKQAVIFSVHTTIIVLSQLSWSVDPSCLVLLPSKQELQLT